MVSKERRLFVLEGVRIHLDRVEGLGRFIELEGVVAGNAEPAEFERLLSELRRAFAISADDLVRGSYSDLLAS